MEIRLLRDRLALAAALVIIACMSSQARAGEGDGTPALFYPGLTGRGFIVDAYTGATSFSFGQTALDSMTLSGNAGAVSGQALSTPLGFSMRKYARRQIEDGPARLDMTLYSAWVGRSLVRTLDHQLSVAVSAELRDLGADDIAFANGQEVSDEWWDVDLSFRYVNVRPNGAPLGVSARVGSSSDKPFHSSKEWTYDVTVDYLKLRDDMNIWMYYVNVSNDRTFLPNVPLPGFAYIWRTDSFQAVLGLPFLSFDYHPGEKWKMELSYSPLTDVHATFWYMPAERWKLYAAFDWDSSTYRRADRDEDDDRVFFSEQRISAGAKFDLNDRVVLDLSGGYAFKREVFERENYRDSDDGFDIDSGAFGTVTFGVRF